MNPCGIGVDIIEICRVKSACAKNPRVLSKLFSEKELADYKERGSRMETLAGKFAAKEAVVKAMGTGLRGFSWTELEILPDQQGKPNCFFLGKAAEKLAEKKLSGVMLSIAHNKTVAIANAIAIKREDSDEACNE